MNDLLSSAALVLSVTALNRAVKSLLERDFTAIWVAGEISNLTIAASGHWYFSLKDANAQVRAVMFRNRAVLLPFRAKEGMRIEARVNATLYEARGEFQLNVDAMRPAGLGVLYEAFERLKAELQAAGLFAAERKRLLPRYPAAIGIVTSPQAAALQDILATLQRRAPHIRVVLYPTPVQGEGAAQKIAVAIQTACARAEVEVLLLARGGGSIEDLWAFNEEVVARAVAAASLPIVTGVGHETDVTIADFVADMRAATPTAAAEMVAPEREALMRRLQDLQQTLGRQAERRIHRDMQRIDYLARRLIHPGERLRRQQAYLALRAQHWQRAFRHDLQRRQWRIESLSARYARLVPDLRKRQMNQTLLARRLQISRVRTMERARTAIQHLAQRLEAVSPDAVLARGYSMVEAPDGRLVRHVDQVKNGDLLRMRFAVGTAAARVTTLPEQQGDLF